MRALLAANQYMTLATTDAEGRPWASTVWYAARVTTGDGGGTRPKTRWLSRPETQHSRNLVDRPGLAITIFDSTQPPDTGEGLRHRGHAGLGRPEDLGTDIATFSARVGVGPVGMPVAAVYQGRVDLHRVDPARALAQGDGDVVAGARPDDEHLTPGLPRRCRGTGRTASPC